MENIYIPKINSLIRLIYCVDIRRNNESKIKRKKISEFFRRKRPNINID